MIRALLCSLLALSLSACATMHRLDAASDVHALLIAIRDNDQAAFDMHVDRRALKAQLASRIDYGAIEDKRLGKLAGLLGSTFVDVAGDVFIQPEVFKLVARYYGYTPETPIPSSLAIASMLKELPDGRVCATRKKDGPCLITFTKEGEAWRLTSYDGDPGMLRLKL